MARFRLGILQVNHDRSREIGDRFPDDLHRFRDLLDRLTMRFDYRVYMTIGGELPASVDEQDGYLITGSPLSVLDDSLFWRGDLMDFIRRCDQAKSRLSAPVSGIRPSRSRSAAGWRSDPAAIMSVSKALVSV